MTAAAERAVAQQVSATIIASGLLVPDTQLAIDANTCSVDYLPRFAATDGDLDTLRIVVAPRTRTNAMLSRSSRRREVVVQIGIMQKCEIGGDLFTALMDLTAAVDDLLATASNNATVSSVTRYGEWSSSEVSLYDIATLEQHQVYRSVISATYWIPS